MGDASDSNFTVSGASILALSQFVGGRGGRLDVYLGELGLDVDALADPETRVPTALNTAAWARAVELTGDSDLGIHFAELVDLDAFHLVGHLVASAKTFGEGLQRIVEYSRLLHDAGRTEIEHVDGSVHVYPGCRGLPSPPRQVAEFSSASLVLLGRLVTGAFWSPRAVRFEHARPARVSEHVRVFGVEPQFSCPETVLILERSELDRPVRAGDTRVGEYLASYARELVARLPDNDSRMATQVQRALSIGLPSGMPSIQQVASQLGMTARTLQRRLAEEDTSFARIGDEVRRASAERYLSDGHLPIAEIAFLTGFGDPSNFHKAFRRWTGQTPASYRANAAARGT